MGRKHKELAKNTAILMVGKICTQFITFFMLPLYMAILQPSEFGIVDLFNTYVLLLLPIVNFQYDLGLFRFMPDIRGNHDKQIALFSSVMVANFAQCTAYLLLFAFIQPFIHSPYKSFLAVSVVVSVFLNTMMQFARGRGHNGNYAICSIISALSIVVLNVLLIVVIRLGAAGLFISIVTGNFIALLYLFASERAWEFFKISFFNKKLLREINHYSSPLVAANLSWWVLSFSNRSIISMFIGIAANGIYAVASKFSGVIIALYSVFNMAWTESVAVHIQDHDRELFISEAINSAFNLFAAICILVISSMALLFPFIIDEKFNPAYQQIPILMIAVLFQVVCGLYSVIYLAFMATKENAKTAFFATVINLITSFVLIQFLGLYAASISTLLAYAAMAFYRYFDTRKYFTVKLRKTNLFYASAVGVLAVLVYYYNHIPLCQDRCRLN